MSIKLYHVDAFADRVFAGNPAAVCLLAKPAAEKWMQSLAGEMNLSETAFVHPEGSEFRLRWFTPKLEVSLCGHATLASAHVLWEERVVPLASHIVFHTKSGKLVASRRGGSHRARFPGQACRAHQSPKGAVRGPGR